VGKTAPRLKQSPCLVRAGAQLARAKGVKFNPSKLGAWPAVTLGAVIASLSVVAGRFRPRRHGSQTNASDAIDDIELRPAASAEQMVDAGGMESFPASDPLAVSQAVETAHERAQKGGGAAAASAASGERRDPARSPDWLLHPPR
jgi:hypothetical protein